MLSFLGKLMGFAIRSKEYLDLNIAPIIWKLLVGDRPVMEDVEAIDSAHCQSTNSLRNIDKQGINAETFSMTFFETYTTLSTDDRVVPVVPGGARKAVTFENRHNFCDTVDNYRLHEFDRQAAAIRSGLAQVVPIHMLSLFRWDELERMVCGQVEIDVALLRSITEHSGCRPSDPHVQLFWQALEEFNNEERSALIRFTWGRSRLPLTAAAFTQRFKIQSFNQSPADQYLPIAHTCFFSLELPRYSTLEIMKEKLRYAMYNCTSIADGEQNLGVMAVTMGWEDEDD
jgi:hypothetical protein